MENISLSGRIIAGESGSEASLIIPVGKYNIMILSDDSCGEGKGKIIRSELFVYTDQLSNNVNSKIFGCETVTADTETLIEAIQFCQRQLRKQMK
ncbi:hypothetical protein Elgi_37150 [Paenibacillus elgii]|uniref:hypothetical protein n=1 Tax=Paenibacillus elgii TaxID=189691 RepID=UPI002D7D1D91|nr:hypothetical protein Elgi_37150 [Paenibacillus elgii]